MSVAAGVAVTSSVLVAGKLKDWLRGVLVAKTCATTIGVGVALRVGVSEAVAVGVLEGVADGLEVTDGVAVRVVVALAVTVGVCVTRVGMSAAAVPA